MKNEKDMLAAEYVLGIMDADARADFEEQFAGNEMLQKQVAHWREEFSALNEEYEEVPPKSDLWSGIEAQLDAAPKSAANDNSAIASARRWKFATFGTAAVAACLALILFLRPPEIQREYLAPANNGALVAQLQGDIDGLLLTASYNLNDGEMAVDVDGMPETETEPEIWVQRPDNSTISLGQIGRDGISKMVVPQQIRQYLNDGAMLILTMEPASKTPHDAPTGDAVATGRATLIT